MEKILVLTDLHLRAPGRTIIGLDPIARLRAVYDAMLTDHTDAAALILMGDLTHSGHGDEYAVLRDILATCPVPVTYMLGNHDARPAFDGVFADAPRTQHGHLQCTINLPHHRIITLYTHQPDAQP